MVKETIQQKKDDLRTLEAKLANLEKSRKDDLGGMKSDMDKLQKQIEELKKQKKQTEIKKEPEVKPEEEKDEESRSFGEGFKIVKVIRSNGEIEDDWRLMDIQDGIATVMKKDKSSGDLIRKFIPENELLEMNPENKVSDISKEEELEKEETTFKTGDTVVFDGDNLELENEIEAETPKDIIIANEKINEAEKKVDDLRIKFLEEYDKCKKEADKQNLISKTKNAILNIFRSKENRVHTKPEDFFTEDTLKAKKEYNEARISMGNIMHEEKKAELEKAGLSGADLEKALQEYKATEILAKTIVDERQKLIDAKINGKEVNKSMWKKLIDGYIGLKPRWKKVAISTLLFTAAAGLGVTTGGVFAGYGLASMAAMKFGTSMAIGTFVGHAAKGVDLIARKSDARFATDKMEDRNIWARRFSKGEIDQEKYEEEIGKIEEAEKKRARNRVLLKAGVGIALAGSAGFLAYDALGHGLAPTDATSGADMNNVKIDGNPLGTTPKIANPMEDIAKNISKPVEHVYPSGSGVTPNIDNVPANPMQNIVDSINKPDMSNVYPSGSGVTANIENNNVLFIKTEAVADNGQGAISTLRELQKNLKINYGDNIENAPASVKHILDTDASKLAEEYGMYKPGQDAESVFIKSGSSFRVDESGNIVYHEVSGKDTIPQKGVDVKASSVYEGKMMDTDNSGLKVEQPVSVKVSNEDISNITKGQDLNGKIINENTPGDISGSNGNEGATEGASDALKNELVGTYHRNISILFPGNDIGIWDNIKNDSAMEFIVAHENKEDIYKPLLSYIGKLEEVSGLKPRIETLTEPAESVTQFISRALKKIQEAGQLDKVAL